MKPHHLFFVGVGLSFTLSVGCTQSYLDEQYKHDYNCRMIEMGYWPDELYPECPDYYSNEGL